MTPDEIDLFSRLCIHVHQALIIDTIIFYVHSNCHFPVCNANIETNGTMFGPFQQVSKGRC